MMACFVNLPEKVMEEKNDLFLGGAALPERGELSSSVYLVWAT